MIVGSVVCDDPLVLLWVPEEGSRVDRGGRKCLNCPRITLVQGVIELGLRSMWEHQL